MTMQKFETGPVDRNSLPVLPASQPPDEKSIKIPFGRGCLSFKFFILDDLRIVDISLNIKKFKYFDIVYINKLLIYQLL